MVHFTIKTGKKITILIGVLLFSGVLFSQQYRVACIGNSITAGVPPTLTYPHIMQGLLPSEHYKVVNLGVSSKTLIFSTNGWINETVQTDSIKSFQPNIVTIKLGTNDCSVGLDGNLFKADYLRLVDSVISWSTPDVKIYLCLPIPLFNSTDNNNVMTNTIIPIINEVATETGLSIIDLNTPFIGHPEYVVDGIHPSGTGFDLLAELIYEGIRVNITSITIKTLGDVPPEITTAGGFLVFEADFEPVYASHTEIVWSMEVIDGDAIIGGRTIQAVSNGTVKMIATSPDGGPLVTDEMIITISEQAEVNQIDEHSGLIIYPNPTKNILYLKNIDAFEKLELFNLQSKKLLQLGSYSESIDLSFLPDNIYIMKITKGENVLSFTIIKD